jgi:hemerythrin-like metal-binding protein
MALIKWGKRYSVGVRDLDDQHKIIVGILNELHAVMLKGQAQSVADTLLPKLRSVTCGHFSTEERLLESTKFPGLNEQRTEHGALLDKVDGFVTRYKCGDNTMYPELLYFMRDWLLSHDLNVDKKYTSWLNEHGIR